jgi:hypothetical protein
MHCPEVSEKRLAGLAIDLRTWAHGRRSVIFAVEPHGYQCLAAALLFTGYGTESAFLTQLGVEFMQNTRIVGHWIVNFFPFLNWLYAVFGVITSNRNAVERALVNGRHLVLIPSGLAGKQHSVEHRSAMPFEEVDILTRPDQRFGFLSLAARHSALVVPVLVPDEQDAYQALWSSAVPWFLRPTLGKWLLFPLVSSKHKSMRVLVGEPINGGEYDGRSRKSIAEFAKRYYGALQRLGEANGVKVNLH